MPTAYSPMNFFAVAAKAMLDANESAQKAAIHALERVAKSDTEPFVWLAPKIPVPNPEYYFDEDLMRDSFHALADANLRSWGHAADMIKAHLPAPSESTRVAMCGPPAMTEKAIKPALEQLGYAKDSMLEF